MTATYAYCLMRYLIQSAARTRGELLGILGGVCRPVLQILTLFQTKNAIFHTRFQLTHR